MRLEEIDAIHLDAVGGVAGDMFVAAFLDVLPELEKDCVAAVAKVVPGVGMDVLSHSDGVLTGRRVVVSASSDPGGTDQEPQHHHPHRHWSDIKVLLETSALEAGVIKVAIGIFQHLAEAEAKVHGIAPEHVAFHEVGAWDSIADIVATSVIIASVPGCKWTIGALPRGRGLVRSAHGMLPLPAPATAELLAGYEMIDDGEDGERVTPTGAAIVRYLDADQAPDVTPRRLIASGNGFGTRTFKQRSNILRVTLYGSQRSALRGDVIQMLRCEIDDQTPEDLAIALAHIRQSEDVLDVCQWPVFGKKGRMMSAIQVLAEDGAQDRIARMLLDETTTLGVRHGAVSRTIVNRSHLQAPDGVRVKRAERPGGGTYKAESDDLREIGTARGRERARRTAESAAEEAAAKIEGNSEDE